MTFAERESSFQFIYLSGGGEGMTIYAVQRETEGWQPVAVHALEDGDHVIDHGGIRVPVSVQEGGRKVTIHLSQVEGDLTGATVDGMGDDWTVAERGNLVDVTLQPDLYPNSAALHVFSSEEQELPALLLERHEVAPQVADVARRK